MRSAKKLVVNGYRTDRCRRPCKRKEHQTCRAYFSLRSSRGCEGNSKEPCEHPPPFGSAAGQRRSKCESNPCYPMRARLNKEPRSEEKDRSMGRRRGLGGTEAYCQENHRLGGLCSTGLSCDRSDCRYRPGGEDRSDGCATAGCCTLARHLAPKRERNVQNAHLSRKEKGGKANGWSAEQETPGGGEENRSSGNLAKGR